MHSSEALPQAHQKYTKRQYAQPGASSHTCRFLVEIVVVFLTNDLLALTLNHLTWSRGGARHRRVSSRPMGSASVLSVSRTLRIIPKFAAAVRWREFLSGRRKSPIESQYERFRSRHLRCPTNAPPFAQRNTQTDDGRPCIRRPPEYDCARL